MRKILQEWDLGEASVAVLGPSDQSHAGTGMIQVETIDSTFRVHVSPEALLSWAMQIEQLTIEDSSDG